MINDEVIILFDHALKVLSGNFKPERDNPAKNLQEGNLNNYEKRHSGSLMRINHTGEVCAQALYDSQAYFTKNIILKEQFLISKKEEIDHLIWTKERLYELGSRPSFLNPIWYLGAFFLGAIASKAGDKHSLGFVLETEIQVEKHLNNHLRIISINDLRSREIIHKMKSDEKSHGDKAQNLGATEIPRPAKIIMNGVSKLMTSITYYI